MSDYDPYVCPKMTCSSWLVFDEPFIPCAKHQYLGHMVRQSKSSRRKKAYRLAQRYAYRVAAKYRAHKNATNKEPL